MKSSKYNYLFFYKPEEFLIENFESKLHKGYNNIISNLNEKNTYQLYEIYKKTKENINFIKDNYDSIIDPIKSNINQIKLELNNLQIYFKDNSKYEIFEKGFFKKTKHLKLIWNSENCKSVFLNKFDNLLSLFFEMQHEKYKNKFFEQYEFNTNFHGNIEHVCLHEFEDDLIKFVEKCIKIYSKYFPEQCDHLYIKGAGTNGTIKVFWDEIDMHGWFLRLSIPSDKYSNLLEKKQKEFEENVLPLLDKRIAKFEREKQASSSYSYIYVLSNEAYPDTYKIGSTSGTPHDRATELNSTGVLHPFKVSFQIEMKNAEYFEITTHKLLNKYRVRKNREFFKLNLSLIENCLKNISKISNKGEKKLSIEDLKKEINI